MLEEYANHDIAVYGGFMTDNAKLLQSTSGGIATALSEYILSQGGYVAGVAYSEDFYKAEYILIHDASQLHRLKGSKYIECDKNNIYAQVKTLLEQGETVLFFGLPCVVAALYKSLGDRPEKLLTCELVCHGPTDPKVHSDYIAFLEKKYKSKVVDFSVRYKDNAWLPGYVYAKFANGKVFKQPFNDTEYGFAFTLLGRKSCYECKFKANNRTADITVGDFVGAAKDAPYWNKLGVSSVFAETEKGNAFLRATPGIALFETTFEQAAGHNPMLLKSRKLYKNRDLFAKLLAEKGLMYAVPHASSTKTRIRRFIVNASPKFLKPTVKKLFSR